jgi:hypothetical protein
MAVVSDLEMDQAQMKPTDVDALALIQTTDPAGLFSQLQMYVPQLQGAAVKIDGVPVALPPLPDAAFVQVPHVAMEADTLAASAGVGMQDEMAVLLENQATTSVDDAPMLLLAYDYGKFMGMVSPMAGVTGGAGMGGIFNSLQKMFGTFVGEVDANDNGIVLRYRLNMFPDHSGNATP